MSGHSFPPYAGDGLLHERTRIIYPSPQVFEQVDQDFQLDHSPSTVSNFYKKKKYNQDPIHQSAVIVSGEAIGSPRLSPLCSVHIESHASSDTSASLTN